MGRGDEVGLLPNSTTIPADLLPSAEAIAGSGATILDAADGLLFIRGRVALYAALQAMDIQPGDEIIVPGFTCVVVPNAILYLGAKPVFVDINRGTYNIDPNLVAAKITPRTRAIVAQHTFGVPARMDELRALASRHNLYLIEDSAHAIGSVYKGQAVGTLGDVAFFSCQWSKPVTTGLGGWAVVNNLALAERMKSIHAGYRDCSFREMIQIRLQYLVYRMLYKPSTFWFAQGAYRLVTRRGLTIGSASWEETEGKMPSDYAAKMSKWQEKTLARNLARIGKVAGHRRKMAAMIHSMLQDRGVDPFVPPADTVPVLLRYPVLVDDKERVLRLARRKRIELGDWFISPVHPLADRWEMAGYERGMCPVAEDVCRHVVNLPTHTGVSESDLKRAIDLILG